MYRVSYNNEPVHIFGWDEGLERFAITEKTAELVPPVVEMSIAEELQQRVAQLQDAA